MLANVVFSCYLSEVTSVMMNIHVCVNLILHVIASTHGISVSGMQL